MTNQKLKEIWFNHYKSAQEQLNKISEANGLISAFNANIDAVIKISGKKIEEIINKFSMNTYDLLSNGQTIIKTNQDVIRGLIKCFKDGIAEEWLIEDINVFNWLDKNIGYEKKQMGGQGGIVANIMAVCGVNPVYVHTASSPKEQADLFLNLDNLKNVDKNGNLQKAHKVARENDTPLTHWIIEFDKGDKITIDGKTITCPKANRFIATYDPLNFVLHIDELFHNKMIIPTTKFEYIILSGFQMLQSKLPNGQNGKEKIDISRKYVKQWKNNHPESILHFEIASTQDKAIRKYLIDNIVADSQSIGFNERELIEILEVIGHEKISEECNTNTNSSNLFKGMIKLFDYVKCDRMQLHMFGLYITLQKKGFRISAIQNRKGMQLAANIAASKAGTGAINSSDVLLWSSNQKVSDIGLKELNLLSETITELYGTNNLNENGIYENDEIEIIAVPTIIIDNPITLVGMGDTISSVSLVGAR